MLDPDHVFFGIDPSLNGTGVCLLDYEGGIIDAATLVPPKKLQNKAREVERLEWVCAQVEAFAEVARPSLAMLESGSYQSQGQVFSLGEMFGGIRLALLKLDIPSGKIAPASLKKFFTGNGKADKDEMQARALALSGRKLSCDESDAYALARLARYAWLYLHKDPGALLLASKSKQLRDVMKKMRLHRRQKL